jgi:methylmalonyl-CoA/ethylmalonyl-CoA epimerase
MIDLTETTKPGMGHAGFVVPRIDRAIDRWVAEGYSLSVGPTEDPIQRIVCTLLANSIAAVELVEPVDDRRSPVDSRLKRGGGLDHLYYCGEDVSESLAQEQANGGIVACEPVFATTFKRAIGFVQQQSGL